MIESDLDKIEIFNKLEKELQKLFDKKKSKLIFKAKNYTEIMKISLDLLNNLIKKQKEYKKLSLEEQSDIISKIDLFIAQKSKIFEIITEEQYEHIKQVVELKDIVEDFTRNYYTSKCINKFFCC